MMPKKPEECASIRASKGICSKIDGHAGWMSCRVLIVSALPGLFLFSLVLAAPSASDGSSRTGTHSLLNMLLLLGGKTRNTQLAELADNYAGKLPLLIALSQLSYPTLLETRPQRPT